MSIGLVRNLKVTYEVLGTIFTGKRSRRMGGTAASFPLFTVDVVLGVRMNMVVCTCLVVIILLCPMQSVENTKLGCKNYDANLKTKVLNRINF